MSNCKVLVQFIFLLAISSLTVSRLFLRRCSLNFLVSGNVNRICTASSSLLHRGHILFSDPLLIPFRFQIPALNHSSPLLSFLEQQAAYVMYCCWAGDEGQKEKLFGATTPKKNGMRDLGLGQRFSECGAPPWGGVGGGGGVGCGWELFILNEMGAI
jgi:hypothetical protein